LGMMSSTIRSNDFENGNGLSSRHHIGECLLYELLICYDLAMLTIMLGFWSCARSTAKRLRSTARWHELQVHHVFHQVPDVKDRITKSAASWIQAVDIRFTRDERVCLNIADYS
jgi:hypothetical protein